MSEAFLTFQEVADLFNVTPATIYNWHHKRPLPRDPITKLIYYDDLVEWVRKGAGGENAPLPRGKTQGDE